MAPWTVFRPLHQCCDLPQREISLLLPLFLLYFQTQNTPVLTDGAAKNRPGSVLSFSLFGICNLFPKDSSRSSVLESIHIRILLNPERVLGEELAVNQRDGRALGCFWRSLLHDRFSYFFLFFLFLCALYFSVWSHAPLPRPYFSSKGFH